MSKILFVDDDAMVLRGGELILSHAGHDVVTVESGAEALEKLKNDKFDLVFLDMMMPEMSGLETLRHIKASKEFGDIPVIIQTGKSNQNDLDAVFHMGAVNVIMKPYNRDVLMNAAKDALGVS